MLDIQYDTRPIDYQQAIALFRDAYACKVNWHFDKLDCAISWRREPLSIEFEESMTYFTPESWTTVIYRSFQNQGEIGFRTPGKDIDYFLFIYVPATELERIVKENNLQPML